MKNFGGQPAIFDLNPFEISSVQQHQLGAKAESSDGRIFRYGLAGTGGVTLGYLAVAPDNNATIITMAVISGAVGDKHIDFTFAATTATANLYAEGYAVISYGTGIGQTLKVSNHAAFTSGGTSVVYLEDPIQVALDTTSKLDLYQNQYNGVISVTTDAAVSTPAGVPLVTQTAGYYGWYQTRGVCSVAADNTIAAGYEVQGDVNDSGKVDVTGTDAQVIKIGHALQAGADTYSHAIFLTID